MKFAHAFQLACRRPSSQHRVCTSALCSRAASYTSPVGGTVVERVVKVAFEYPFHSVDTSNKKTALHRNRTHLSKPDSANRIEKATTKPTPEDVHVHIDPSNPIYQLLHSGNKTTTSSKPKGTTKATAPNAKTKTRTTPPVSHTNATTHLSCAAWSRASIAPLVMWLDRQGVRYTYSDWETQMTNGERERIVSQRGQVCSDTQTLHTRCYVCDNGFRNVRMRLTTSTLAHHHDQTGATAAKDTDSARRDWWQLDQPNHDPTTDGSYARGVHHHQRQHRVYQWNPSTTLHLSTTDEKHFRVWVEYVLHDEAENVDEKKDSHVDAVNAVNAVDTVAYNARMLMVNIAYHLAQHVHRQRRVRVT